MALTIGELVGYISFDTAGVDEGVDHAEVQMRQLGNEITTVAERAGIEAGQGLGENMSRALEDEVDGLDDVTADAGHLAGQALGDGLAQGTEEGASRVESVGDGMFSKLKMAAVAAGVAAGAALMAGVGEAMEQGKIQGRLGAQLGATGEEAAKYGHIAGKMYANAITEDFQGAADAIRVTMSSGLLPSGATEAQIQSIATKVADLSNTFELDLGQAANAVGQLMKNKLAPDAQTAIDVITRGMQVMGPRADDLADTLNEYSPIFQAMGFSAQQATGLLAQGMRAGARDTDTVADAIKEFSIRAIDGSKASSNAFHDLHLDADKMTAMIAKGGTSASEGMQLVLDKLRAMKDPVQQNAIAVGLFGTKSEDMRNTLLALDPSKAVSALGQVGGAADKVGESLRANAGVQVEQFKRKMEEGFVQLIGTHVVPKLMMLVEAVKNFKNSPEFDKLVQFAHTAWEAFTKLVSAVKDMLTNFSPLISLVGSLASGFLTLLANVPPKVLMEIATALGIIFLAVKTYTTYVMIAAAVTRTWAIAQGILNAVMMLNPVGLVIAAIVALIAIFVIAYKHSETFREIVQAAWAGIKMAAAAAIEWLKGAFHWFEELPGNMSRWWNSAMDAAINALVFLVKWVYNFPGMIADGLKGLAGALWNSASNAFGNFKDAAVGQVMSFVNWLRNIPGMIVDIIKDTTWRLYNAGQDIIYGLWNGIKSMAGWLKTTLINWALAVIPGPIARALGIGSPSKLMAKEVGRWIPAGVVQGIEQGRPALEATMTGLVSPTGGPMGAVVGTGPQQVVVKIEVAGPQEVRALIRSIVQKNGGNVQQVFT